MVKLPACRTVEGETQVKAAHIESVGTATEQLVAGTGSVVDPVDPSIEGLVLAGPDPGRGTVESWTSCLS
jgi:hypothetical protein